MPRCQAKNKNGDQCKNNSIAGRSYCYLSAHGANASPLSVRFCNFLRNRIVDLSLIGLLLTLLGFWEHRQEKAQESFDGKLESNSYAKERRVSFGFVPLKFDGSEGPIFTDHGESLISLKNEHGKLLISFKIRDENGSLIAELVDNEWKLNKNLIFDRNYTDQALEVRDSAGKVVLQIFNHGSVIQLAGVFRSKDGRILKIIPNPDGAGGALFDRKADSAYEITAIFKYPSSLHPGECPSCDALRNVSWTNLVSYRISKPLELFPVVQATHDIR